MMDYFCNPFSISVTGVPMLIHGDDFCFCSYSVKECFDVVTECSTDFVGELLHIF